VTVLVKVGCLAVISNFALVAPAKTRTLDGTLTKLVFVVEIFTSQPPVGASDLRVTVPTEVPFTPTVLGVSFRLEIRSPAIVSVAFEEEVASVAVIVHLAAVDVAFPVIVKDAVVAPADTVTFDGMFTRLGALADNFTTHPPAGAADFRVTVPVEAPPLPTVVGLKLKWDTASE
jgi:hypothetical protein